MIRTFLALTRVRGVDGGVAGIEQAIESGAADAQHFGGADFVAIGAGENASDVVEDSAVEIGIIDDGIDGRGCGFWNRPLQPRNVDGPDPLTGTFESGGNDDGFQLADIARPGVGGEAPEGAGGETTHRLVVLLAPGAEKQARKQGDVVFAVAEWRNGEADGGEVTGEIGAERAGGGQAAEGLGRAGDELQGGGDGDGPDALVGGALEEIAEAALLFRGQLVDAREIGEAGAGLFPERS